MAFYFSWGVYHRVCSKFAQRRFGSLFIHLGLIPCWIDLNIYEFINQLFSYLINSICLILQLIDAQIFALQVYSLPQCNYFILHLPDFYFIFDNSFCLRWIKFNSTFLFKLPKLQRNKFILFFLLFKSWFQFIIGLCQLCMILIFGLQHIQFFYLFNVLCFLYLLFNYFFCLFINFRL